MCKVHSIIGLYILHMNIMSWKHVWHMDKCVNEWIWMNVTWILHFLINMCVKCAFNVRFQCVKCMNYELTNFVQFPLLSCEMLNLWYIKWSLFTMHWNAIMYFTKYVGIWNYGKLVEWWKFLFWHFWSD